MLLSIARLAGAQLVAGSLLLGAHPRSVPGQDLALESALKKAEAQRAEYSKEFTELASEETKVFRLFSTSGSLSKTRKIRSVFFIHNAENDLPAEFRNVVEVDGKTVKDSSPRIETFFSYIAAIKNTEDERQKIYEQSLRYDIGIRIDGMTLHQTPVLEGKNRPYFVFTLDGQEELAGRRVLVISYRQKLESPYIAVNRKKRPLGREMSLVYSYFLKDDLDYHERLYGKLWIDADTFQIWKEDRNMELQPDSSYQPFLFVRDTFTYQKSEFGILTPKTIVHEQYRVSNTNLSSSRSAEVEFRYDPFTRPKVLVNGGRPIPDQ